MLIDLCGEAPDPDEHVGDLLDHLERYRRRPTCAAPASIDYEVDGELEGDRRELQRVPALPRRPPGAQRAQPLHERRGGRRRGRLVRRLDDPARGRLDDGARGRRPRRRAGRRSTASPRTDADTVLYFAAVPERARLAAPRLRDAAHPLAARAGPHRRHLRVVLRAGDDRPRRLRPLATRSASGTWSTARTGTSAS